MEPIEKSEPRRDLLKKAILPAVVAVGATAAFVATALRTRPEPKTPAPSRPPAPGASAPASGPAAVPAASTSGAGLERQYDLALVIGGAGEGKFSASLAGIAVGPGDSILALGDGDVRTFGPDGKLLRRWKAPDGAMAIAAGPDGRILLGRPGRVESFDASGAALGGFDTGAPGRPAAVTALKAQGGEILAADGSARLIRRHDAAGKPLGEIGTQNFTKCFILPNRSLDFGILPDGTVIAGDSGRHLVTAWARDGAPRGSFGKFGMRDPADFTGCCNPVNIAMGPEGTIITGEKAPARVKVYAQGSRLLALIGPENFDQSNSALPVACDGKGRIIAADPARREIRVFARTDGPGAGTGTGGPVPQDSKDPPR